MGRGTGWLLGILAVALWAGAPYGWARQQQATGNTQQANQSSQGAGTASRTSPGTAQAGNQGVNSSGATGNATSIPESGTPTIENPQPTGTLDTMPNQTLSPGATTVPSNAGGIAPASNDASSGADTPSQGQTAPNTPGANPSDTQGVPTFSSGAQPLDANLPRTVAPRGTTAPRNQGQKSPQ